MRNALGYSGVHKAPLIRLPPLLLILGTKWHDKVCQKEKKNSRPAIRRFKSFQVYMTNVLSIFLQNGCKKMCSGAPDRLQRKECHIWLVVLRSHQKEGCVLITVD